LHQINQSPPTGFKDYGRLLKDWLNPKIYINILNNTVLAIEELMDSPLDDLYKKFERTGDIKPRVRRATTLSKGSKKKATKGFKRLDGKKQDVEVRTGIIRDNKKQLP